MKCAVLLRNCLVGGGRLQFDRMVSVVKKLTYGLVASVLLALANAPEASAVDKRPPSNLDSDTSKWLRVIAGDRMLERMDQVLAGNEQSAGSVRIYSLSEYPAPDSIKEKIASGIEQKKQGVQLVPSDKIASAAAISESLRGASRLTSEELRQRLTAPPSDVSHTTLARANLLSTTSAGGHVNGRATGLSRVFEVPRMGVVELCEDDYVSSGAQHNLVREALNAEVNGIPAISYASRTIDGRGKATLSWVTSQRSYSLILLTDDATLLSQGQRLLMDIATGLE